MPHLNSPLEADGDLTVLVKLATSTHRKGLYEETAALLRSLINVHYRQKHSVSTGLGRAMYHQASIARLTYHLAVIAHQRRRLSEAHMLYQTALADSLCAGDGELANKIQPNFRDLLSGVPVISDQDEFESSIGRTNHFNPVNPVNYPVL